jgi:hypothetical protein
MAILYVPLSNLASIQAQSYLECDQQLFPPHHIFSLSSFAL